MLQPCVARQRQQFVAAVEGVRQHGGVGRDHLVQRAVGRDFVADDEAAADRVVVALGEFGTGGVEGREAHAVGVERQGLAAVELEVGLLVEGDRVAAGQRQAAGRRG